MPSILAMILVPFMPESPRWLMFHDRSDESFEVLKTIHGHGEETELVVAEFKEIQDTIEFEKANNGSWKSLIAPSELIPRKNPQSVKM